MNRKTLNAEEMPSGFVSTSHSVFTVALYTRGSVIVPYDLLSGATLINIVDGAAAGESWPFKQNAIREYGQASLCKCEVKAPTGKWQQCHREFAQQRFLDKIKTTLNTNPTRPVIPDVTYHIEIRLACSSLPRPHLSGLFH
jgi:hypothetical protein